MRNLSPNTLRVSVLANIAKRCDVSGNFNVQHVSLAAKTVGLKNPIPANLACGLIYDGYATRRARGEYKIKWEAVDQLMRLGAL